MFTKNIFINYDVEILLHNDTNILLQNDNDIAEVLHNIIELFEDNTANNKIDNKIQEHLHSALYLITHYQKQFNTSSL